MANTIEYGQGAVNNTIGWGQGAKVGGSSFSNTKSIELDGVDDFVDIGHIAELNNASAFTYSGWYKQTTIDQIRPLIESFVNTNNWFGVYTYTDGNMYIQFQKTNNYYGYFDYSTLISADTWFNIIVVYNGSGLTNADKFKCYINGTEVTLSFVGTIPTTTPSGTNNLKIARADKLNATWLGKVDEVAIWDSELSASQVTEIYNSGVPNDISSLSPLSWWRMGDGDTAPTIIDHGSGGNNGTMTNFSTFSTDVPT